MIKKNRKIAMCAFMLVIFLVSGALVAFATTLYSSWRYYGPVNGFSYQNRAFVSSDYPNGVYAVAQVKPQSGGSAPAGYMGARARLYNGSGSLVNATSWYYTNSVSWGLDVYGDDVYTTDSYYSYGQSKAYNGSGYNTYDTYQSPNVNYP